MKFCNFLLRVDGIREASLEDMKDVVAKGNHIFRPQKQKYLYSIDMDILEERFLLFKTLSVICFSSGHKISKYVFLSILIVFPSPTIFTFIFLFFTISKNLL